MASGICSECGKSYRTGEFENHPCVKNTMEKMKSPGYRREMLKRLYDAGGCSQEYYESEMSKLKESN